VIAADDRGGTPLFDCHCHLQAADFDGDREAVVQRARAAGVQRVLAVSEDLADAGRVLDLARRHPDFVAPALGVHPDRAPELDDGEVADVVQLIRKESDRLAAVGEVGLDFRPRWDERARERQVEVFRTMIQLARELGLPVSVHSRSAGHHALDVLRSEGAEAACLHAFDGRAAHGERGAADGFFFSIPPSIVRSRVKQKLVARLPAEALLLESDSPVLGPSADERNEPANLATGLAEIARLRGDAPAELAAIMARSTAEVFPRLTDPAP
jgi:TatD DNase family protein